MSTLEKWTDFFRTAGLPREVANTYAHSFTENRIQMSMLPDLNKEYLREMGIFRMGDIILILRQAKSVQEKVQVVSGGKRKVSDDSEDERQVLKRKITVLSEKLRPEAKLISKKEVLTEESDDEPPPIRKKLVTEPQKTRISLKSVNDREVPQRLTLSTKSLKRADVKNSSIFDRLGSKSADPHVKPILKSISTPPVSTQVKNQRVLLVKKVPAKATYESSNDSDENLTDDESDYVNTSTEKSVSFSAQDEVIEIAAQKKGILKKRLQMTSTGQQNKNVKARLGIQSPIKNASNAMQKMRLQSQQSPARNTSIKLVKPIMRSDEIILQQKKNVVSVHQRLFKKQPESPAKKSISVVNPGRKIKLTQQVTVKNGSGANRQKNNGSVFDRLGYNNRK
uniref:CSON001096 protein n=1 Tax=Culicoides sonorensis TaxID=179676 RepID=A0A336MFX6_CULSO